jgi:hypothetical protein
MGQGFWPVSAVAQFPALLPFLLQAAKQAAKTIPSIGKVTFTNVVFPAISPG